jgi:cytochrome c oxidase assembly factor CtaG
MAGWNSSFWLTAWSWEPGTLIGIGVVIIVYFAITFPLSKRFTNSDPPNTTRILWFTLGIFAAIIALMSPINIASKEYLFSAHMIQHILITLVMAPMLLAGTPSWLISVVMKHNWIQRFTKIITNPILTFFLYFLSLSFWHLPSVHTAMMGNEVMHTAQTLSFIVTGLLFWWPVIIAVHELPKLSDPLKMLYLFLAVIPCTVLGVVIIFAPTVMASSYSMAARITPFDPMTDQQVAGILMAVPSMFILLGTMLSVFYKWYKREGASRGTSTSDNKGE